MRALFVMNLFMNLIFLQEGMTASLIPILTLIEHKADSIVGCVLLAQNETEHLPPSWFVDSTLAKNSAAELLKYVDSKEVLKELDIFLIVKEPNSLLQFNVLAAVGCCNLNYSGAGGSRGRRVLELLAKHNIQVYPAEVLRPTYSTKKSLSEWHGDLREAFEHGFNVVAQKWLPQCWGLDAVDY